MTGGAILLSLPKRTMKRWINRSWSLGLVLAGLPLVGGFPQENSNQPTNSPVGVQTALAPGDTVAPGTGAAPPAPAEIPADADVVDAPAKPISTAKPLPPAVRPSGPVAEVVKLADSGVEESVMLAFVANSTSTFNLGAEEIIYLNDVGIPSEVVTAMIQHDQALKNSLANAGPAPAAPPPAPTEQAPPAPEPSPAPAPADMAPQPDNATGNYPPPADNAYASFYDSLAPYGTWLDVAGYGPCWQPNVVVLDAGWQPYCNGGRWVYTDCGWYWLSGYSWGWAPFHYGRWFRLSHYGWCWMPGNLWGPSWVCWRYTGSYYGWAPLPPAAVYQPAVGLTYHGQRVSGSFAFGLGVKSYAFVEASHFTDHHLKRYALLHQQAAQIYNQTVPSTTITGNGTRIVNQGIPVSHVAATSRSQIRMIGIRDINAAGARGPRAEQLESNSRTLSVFRPQFPQSTGAQSLPGGRPRSDIRQTGGNPVVMPATTTPQATPVQSPRAPGGSLGTQPSSGGGSGRRPDRSANRANAAPITPTTSTASSARTTSDPAPRLAQPLILHGSDRSRESTDGTGASSLGRAVPLTSLIVRGNSPDSRWRPLGESAALATEVPQSSPAAPHPDSFSRSAGTRLMHPFTMAAAEMRAPAWPFGSAWRASEPFVRSERPWQPAAPAYKAPSERLGARSHSPPTASPASQAEPTPSRSVHSTSSASAAHSHSSSDKGPR